MAIRLGLEVEFVSALFDIHLVLCLHLFGSLLDNIF